MFYMSPEDLVTLIDSVCHVSTPNKTPAVYEKTVDCIEHFSNCMIKADSTIHIGDLKECHEQWTFNQKKKI